MNVLHKINVLKNIVKLLKRKKDVLISVIMITYINMNIIRNVMKNVLKKQFFHLIYPIYVKIC